MGRKQILLKDIAKALGVSVTTVSRALKDSWEIGEETKKRIVDYAKLHNYRPSPSAVKLRKDVSRSLGVVISGIDNIFLSQLLNGVESSAYQQGYTTLFTQSQESVKLEFQNIDFLKFREVDGIIISLSAETSNIDHFRSLQEEGLPIVLVDRISNKLNTHKVITDNFQGAYTATSHLIASGHRLIAHMTSSTTSFITKERLKGYKQALTDNGIRFDDRLVKYCDHGGQHPHEIDTALTDLLSLTVCPTAIFGAVDRITTGLLILLNERGIKIPDEMAIAGFTNNTYSTIFNPPLTTVTQPAFEMGKAAAELLIELIENKNDPVEFRTIILPSVLHIRRSSGQSENIEKISSE